ncbi:hypothetical protein [Nitrososphaera sp.]|uniref:hypothetical protein n=1 Tax=Nitrososphaera sp. TaxID=1971748 RepID=UPI00307EDC03
MTASLEQVEKHVGVVAAAPTATPTVTMTPDEAAFCSQVNADLQSRGLNAHFNYIRRKSTGGFEFDLAENEDTERCLDVFDRVTATGWLRFLSERNIAFTE